MSWAVGFDPKWKRDIGYGVPAECDHPDCHKIIDRGLAHVCGGEPKGGDKGCGLYFCSEHLSAGDQLCERCVSPDEDGQVVPFEPKPDVQAWIDHKATDPSWEKWRKDHQ